MFYAVVATGEFRWTIAPTRLPPEVRHEPTYRLLIGFPGSPLFCKVEVCSHVRFRDVFQFVHSDLPSHLATGFNISLPAMLPLFLYPD